MVTVLSLKLLQTYDPFTVVPDEVDEETVEKYMEHYAAVLKKFLDYLQGVPYSHWEHFIDVLL